MKRTPLILFVLMSVLPATIAGEVPAMLPEVASEVEIRTDWNVVPPGLLWHRRTGPGTTSFAVKDKSVVVGANDGARDVWWCIDSDHGTPLWHFVYEEAPRADQVAAGPAATAVIDRDRVYLLSKSGKLHCVDLESGELLWKRHLAGEPGIKNPESGFTASPVVRGDAVMAGEGVLLSMDRGDGSVLWRSEDLGGSNRTTPRVIGHEGGEVLLMVLENRVVGLGLEGDPGKVVFEHEWEAGDLVHGNRAEFADGLLFLPSGRNAGFASYEWKDDSFGILHQSGEEGLRFHSGVRIGGDYVGVALAGEESSLVRVEMRSGNVRWSKPLPGTRGSCVLAGEHLMVLCESGEILVGTPGEGSFEEHARIGILNGPVWAPLVHADQRFYARNNQGTVLCMNVAPLKTHTPAEDGDPLPEEAP